MAKENLLKNNQAQNWVNESRQQLPSWLRNNELSARQVFYSKTFGDLRGRSSNTTKMISKIFFSISIIIFLSFAVTSYSGKKPQAILESLGIQVM